MSSVFTIEATGISQEDIKEVLQDFHERIVAHAKSMGTGSTVVIKGLRFQRTDELQMSPLHLLRSTAFFSTFEDDHTMSLDLQMMAETLYEILVYHHSLGGGWIKVVTQQPFEQNAGHLLYESSPSAGVGVILAH